MKENENIKKNFCLTLKATPQITNDWRALPFLCKNSEW